MKFHKTSLSGVYLIELPRFEDTRGKFIRTFNDTVFKNEIGYAPVFEESYYSHSQKHVIRGMHFQTAPHAQDKLVYVVLGSIRDVVLDINPKSSTYGKFESFELSAENNKALFMPKGYAHGFASLSDETITSYMITAGYAPENDTGVHWDSFGYDWKIEYPIVSEKDQKLTNFGEKEFTF